MNGIQGTVPLVDGESINKKPRRSCRKIDPTTGDEIWSEYLESCLIEALEITYHAERAVPQRCRFISNYIKSKTGVLRTAKQVRSCVQQMGRRQNSYLARIARGKEQRSSTECEPGGSRTTLVTDKACSRIGSSRDQDTPDIGVSPPIHGHQDLYQGVGQDLGLHSLQHEDILPRMGVDTRTIALYCETLSTLGSEPCHPLLPKTEQGLTSQHNGYRNSGSLQQQVSSPYRLQGTVPPSNACPARGYDQYSFN
ncbi:hypothetical protein AX15_005359, partial [Amanita polypyramis BW_CC]